MKLFYFIYTTELNKVMKTENDINFKIKLFINSVMCIQTFTG